MPAFPAAASTRPRRKILSAVGLALVLVASLMAFVTSPVGASHHGAPDECFTEVELTQFKRETFTTEYEYHREVKGDIQFQLGTVWLGVIFPPYTFDWEVSSGNETTTADVDVPVLVEEQPHVTTQETWVGSNGITYRKRTTHLRYVRSDTDPIQIPDDWEYTEDYLAEPPAGDGWEPHDTDWFVDDTFPCPDASATHGTCEEPGEVTPSSSEHYTSEIDNGVVTFTAVPPAVFGGEVQTVFDFSATVAQLGDEECAEEVEAVDPEVTQSSECEAEGELVIPNTGGVQYLLDGEPVAAGSHTGPISGTLNAEALDGHTLTDPEWTFEVDIAPADECEDGDSDVAGIGEEAGDDDGDTAADSDSGTEASQATGASTLPVTGSSAGLLALMAAMAMGLGVVLRTVSRRLL